MKVLHLPTNVASQISTTVRALTDIGIQARGLAWGNLIICDGTGIENYGGISRRSHPIRGTLRTVAWWRAVERAIRWADVIHWHFSYSALPFGLDLRYAARLAKVRLVEFWGSDIRIPEIAAADNPYLARVYEANPELANECASRQIQKRFARYGFQCLVPDFELESYVRRDLFPNVYKSNAALLLSEYEPRYPHPQNTRPLVVHSPSDKVKKGTDAVLRAVEELQKTHRFDFQLIHGMPRPEALAVVRQCDVFLDQFVLGAHGLAALEAMAFGKPAVCYIKPSLLPKYPPDLPIVNADQDHLTEVLKDLLEDGRRRHHVGQRARAYVEEHHDAHQIARRLVGIYEESLEKIRSGKKRANR